MKHFWLATCVLSGLFASAVAPAAPQSKASGIGTLEFEALVTPAESQPEPVRQLPFYLLRKSLADIQSEVAQSEPAPDMDSFIDQLDVSVGLKAWMKKRHTVDFAGLDYTKVVTPSDVIDIPEFLEAYRNLNGSVLNSKLPPPQIKDSAEKKNPEKYKRIREKYHKDLQEYIGNHPEQLQSLDAELVDRTYARQWAQMLNDRKRHADQQAALLAQTRYLVARTDSDLSGHGEFRGLPPGSYWITNLNVPALAGQDRLQWDLLVTIRSSEISRIALSNLNALPSANRPR